MHNLYAISAISLDICKKFSYKSVTKEGNILRCGGVPKFSYSEVIAISMTVYAIGIDSESCPLCKTFRVWKSG